MSRPKSFPTRLICVDPRENLRQSAGNRSVFSICLAGLLLLLSLNLSAQSSETWTVLVYIAGDNNLWQNAVQDINDMESANLPEELTLVVQSDLPASSPYPGGQRRLIRQDSSPDITSPLIQSLGTINSGKAQTLNDFARWGFNQYPSTRKALFIWGHGNSWFKEDSSKWICPDDDAQDVMHVWNGSLRYALSGLPYLDILLFDACSMQSLEVLSEVKDAAWRIIGSEELVPAAGFPYQDFLDWFNGVFNAEQICYGIVDAYIASYQPGGSQNPGGANLRVTCSAVRGNEMNTFLGVLQGFNLKYRERATELLSYREGCWEMNDGYNDVDIYEYLRAVRAKTSDPEMADDADTVINAWYLTRVLEANLNLPLSVGGAAIWFPWHRQYFDSLWTYYVELDFSVSRWISLLNLAYGPDETAPYTPQVLSAQQSLGSLLLRIKLNPDPDDLTLKVQIQTADSLQILDYPLDWGAEDVTLRIPVSGAGSVTVQSYDRSFNLSGPASASFQFKPLPLLLEVHPNPLLKNSGGILRWTIPTGVTGEGSLEIYNLRGQKVLQRSLGQLSPGEGAALPATWPEFMDLGRGLYLLRLKVGKITARAKLTIL